MKKMVINKVTITGADNEIDFFDLIQLQKDYSFLELGILFSAHKTGQLRYPSSQWIGKIIYSCHNLSAHFCGWHSREVLEQSNIGLLDIHKDTFKRFQLNYNFSFNANYSFAPIINWANNNHDNSIILQFNKSNKEALLPFLNNGSFPKNINILYDASGGRGKSILESPLNMPFNYYTGYSGGIDNRNLLDVCNEISEQPFSDKVWIDLESGARTNNHFDLTKVRNILNSCKQYVNE